ncbi:MAG: DUF1015 domain-containing protein [Spirochaetaceae bacterium]|nr:DUF1015 domain-containing protein [Spirochaetaceae bacterium]
MEKINTYGLTVPEILLPAATTDLKAWAVIACDQHTQDREYWKRCEATAAGKPSTLHIILPEVYLGDADKQERIAAIHSAMEKYLKDGVFSAAKKCFIYIERTTSYGRVRKGLVTALDLEAYEWEPDSKALVRATEATIVERIPPRMEIRRGAPLESPHIMLLANDKAKELVEKTGEDAKKREPAYSTPLMENSGSLKGWIVDGEKEMEHILAALETLKKDGTGADGSSFLFAVGDGNHSLATAKAVWNEFKLKNGGVKGADGRISIPAGLENHNARYALVEIVNIYDDGLTFEPIHRVLFNMKDSDADSLIETLCAKLGGKAETCGSKDELNSKVSASKGFVGIVTEKNGSPVYTLIRTDITDLVVSKLQPVLDEFLKAAQASAASASSQKPEIDYIHGSDEVFRLGEKQNSIGILLPPIAKESFFSTIAGNGPLPRKSFSMGEASEKRFYFECRALF